MNLSKRLSRVGTGSSTQNTAAGEPTCYLCQSEKQPAYASHVQEYIMLSEYAQVARASLPGVYVIPSEKSCLVWHGVLFISSGLYTGAALRFTLKAPETGAETCKIFFSSALFHPLVDPAGGELTLPHPVPGVKISLLQTLRYVRDVFVYPHKLPLPPHVNQAASELMETRPDVFSQRVCHAIAALRADLDPPPNVEDAHFIDCSSLPDDLTDRLKSQMLTAGRTVEVTRPRGRSFVDQTTGQVFALSSSVV